MIYHKIEDGDEFKILPFIVDGVPKNYISDIIAEERENKLKTIID